MDLHLEALINLKNIYDFWSSLKDEKNGGFFGRVDYDLKLYKDAPKGVILNSRILYFFSEYAILFSSKESQRLASHAFEFLKQCLDKENDGLFWSLDYLGQPLDTTKHTYNQAFGIYSLSYYYMLTKDLQAKKIALSLFDLIETKCREPNAQRFYIEAQNKDFTPCNNEKLSEHGVEAKRTMNTLLHILEAYTALYRAFPLSKVEKALKEVINSFIEYVFDQANGTLKVFFDSDYHSLLNLESFGHEIEASWLLTEASSLIDDNKLKSKVNEVSSRLAERVMMEGYKDGFIINESESGKEDPTRVWWVQAEGINGFMNAYRFTNEPRYLLASKALMENIDKYFIDPRNHSEWFWDLDILNLPSSKKDIVEPWKCPYHNGRMCFEILNKGAGHD